VKKVRLVADGRSQQYGPTYSATPSREEVLKIMHYIAALEYEYYHLDEERAFLNAPYKNRDVKPTYLILSGNPEYYKVVNAVYGMKDAPRNYQDMQHDRLTKLGFKRLMMSHCIYVKHDMNNFILTYVYVDNFIITGSDEKDL
jgi:hypothetical protein